MRPGFERIVQYLWLGAVAFSALWKVAELTGIKGEMALGALIIVFAASLPLSVLCFAVFDAMSAAGQPLGWTGQWVTIVALGAVQWFVVVPLARRLWSRRKEGGGHSRPS